MTLRREALARGLNDRLIRSLVASQHWHRVRHGAYVERATWEDLSPEDRHRVLARAVLRTAHSPAVLSHLSAAIEHGADTWDVDLSNVHFTRLDGKAGRREAGVVQHRGRLPRDEVANIQGVPVVSVARAIVETTTVTDVEHGLIVANSLGHRHPGSLELARAIAREMDHWQNTLSTRIVMNLADRRIESVAESRALHFLWSQSLPAFEPQYEVRDADGRVVARLDFALPQLGVFLEIDGRTKYDNRRDGKSLEQVLFEEREREKLVCRLTGWVCLRISWADLAHPDRLAREIRAVLLSRRTRVV